MQRFLQPLWRLMRGETGVTCMTLMLGMLLLASLGHLLLGQAHLEASQDTLRALRHNALLALDVISREVRESGYNPTGARFSGLCVTPTGLQIKADRNGDGDTDDVDEDIRYVYDAAKQHILRTDTQRQEVLAEYVQRFVMIGLDHAGQPSQQPTTIRQLRLTVDTGVRQAGLWLLARDRAQTFTLTTQIQVRNVSVVTEPERG